MLVSLDPATPVDTSRLHALRHAALSGGLEVRDLSDRTWLASGGPAPVDTLTVGPWILVGEAFHRRQAPVWRVFSHDPVL